MILLLLFGVFPMRAQGVVAPGPDKKRCLAFLHATMELADQLTVSQDQLEALVALSLKARQRFSWCTEIPDDIFLLYALPYRLCQEPFKQHRAYFAALIGPLVQNTKSIQEAVALVQLWCIAHARFFPSAGWDLAPSDVLARGGGRCEELAILFAAAARSVGIPVRQCFTPAWRDQNGNHFWVEVWTPQGWLPLGATEDTLEPGHVWFTSHAKTASSVLCATPGVGFSRDVPIMRSERTFTYLNLTSRYADSAYLELTVEDSAGHPVPGARITAWSPQDSSPVAVASGNTDLHGIGKLEVGAGTYIVTAWNNADDQDENIVKVVRTGSPVVLRMGGSDALPATLVMENPLPGRPNPFPHLERNAADLFEKGLPNALKRQNALPEGLNAGEPGVFPETVDQNLPTAPLLQRMDPKDRLLADRNELAAHLVLSQAARARWLASELSYPDDAFYDFVANPRVLREPFSLPNAELRSLAKTLCGRDVRTTIDHVLAWVRKLPSQPAGVLAPDLTPSQILQARCVTSQRDRATMTVTLLRLHGIPCRVDSSGYLMEAWPNSHWVPLYPATTSRPQINHDSLVWLHKGQLIPLSVSGGDADHLPMGSLLSIQGERISKTEVLLNLKVLHE